MEISFDGGIAAARIIVDETVPPVPGSMAALVGSEIATATAEGRITRRKYLNNFPNRLRITDRGALNDDHFLVTYAVPVIHAECPEKQGRGFSERYMSDTPQSFIAAVDQAMAETGVDGRKIEQMDALGEEKFLDYILPVYVRLREMGYNHTELIT